MGAAAAQPAPGLRYLLDTNIVSYFIRRVSPGLERQVAEALRGSHAAVSSVTRAELRFGQAGMAPADRRRALVDGLLSQVPCLPWDTEAADRYGVLKDHLRRQGAPIGELDTQIAAHALAQGLVLVTHNTRHFVNVPGLVLEDWLDAG